MRAILFGFFPFFIFGLFARFVFVSNKPEGKTVQKTELTKRSISLEFKGKKILSSYPNFTISTDNQLIFKPEHTIFFNKLRKITKKSPSSVIKISGGIAGLDSSQNQILLQNLVTHIDNKQSVNYSIEPKSNGNTEFKFTFFDHVLPKLDTPNFKFQDLNTNYFLKTTDPNLNLFLSDYLNKLKNETSKDSKRNLLVCLYSDSEKNKLDSIIDFFKNKGLTIGFESLIIKNYKLSIENGFLISLKLI